MRLKKFKYASKICTNFFFNAKMFINKDKMKVTVFYTLDKLINGINSRFNQESLQIINLIGNMVKLKTGENISYKCLKEQFNICEDDLCTEIKLLQNMPDIPNGTSLQIIHE
jgi:hypothetical protein